MLKVEVVYIEPSQLIKQELLVPAGTSVLQAIQKAQLETYLVFNASTAENVGIFSKKVQLDAQVQMGDRIEIYRRLLADPKAARRQKVLLKTK